MTVFKQGNIYHAELKVPKDVQRIIGKNKFRKSLNTTDMNEAKRKEILIVSGWKEKIEIARGNGGDIKLLAQQYRDTSEEGKEILDEVFQGIVADDYGRTQIDQLDSKQGEKALYKYQLLTGQKVLTDIQLNQWLKVWNVNQKGKEQGGRFVKELCLKFPSTDQVTRKNLTDWCSSLIYERKLSSKTVKCRMSPCRIYWEFLQIKGYVDPDKNPFINLKIIQSRKANQLKEIREEFSIDEINQLKNEIKKKSNSHPELLHLYQIAVYTGARIEEICKITKEDINSNSIRIMSSKTQAGIREVPIHDNLVKLIKELLVSSNDKYLITNLKPNRFGERSANIGKRFGRIKTNLGFGPTKVFHSIRKTVVTLLEQAGVPESVTADIVGHEKKTMTYGLYSGGSSLLQKLEAINKIKYN